MLSRSTASAISVWRKRRHLGLCWQRHCYLDLRHSPHCPWKYNQLSIRVGSKQIAVTVH